MTLTALATLSFSVGTLAVLYLLLALADSKKHARVLQNLHESRKRAGSPPSPEQAAVAAALWKRAEILLRHGRFDAAIADSKRALAMAPDHAEARALLDHLFAGEPDLGLMEGSEE